MNFQENNINKKHGNTFFKQFICIVYVPKYKYAKNNHKPERTVRKIRASIWEEWSKSQPGRGFKAQNWMCSEKTKHSCTDLTNGPGFYLSEIEHSHKSSIRHT